MIDSDGSVMVDIHPTMTWESPEEGTSEYRCSGCMMKTVTATPTYTIPEEE
jgi:hypothetical protein